VVPGRLVRDGVMVQQLFWNSVTAVECRSLPTGAVPNLSAHPRLFPKALQVLP
jgi:hypothetical protein